MSIGLSLGGIRDLALINPISTTVLPPNSDQANRAAVNSGLLPPPLAAGLVERLEREVSYTPWLIDHFHPPLPQSSSDSRLTAGAAGFFILSQSFDRPER
jgi:hypothetical protein